MAAFNRPTSASYVLHEEVTVDTSDHEDHTFCGVMFPVECKVGLPVDHMLVTSLSVRGALGPLTVWVSKNEKKEDKSSDGDQKIAKGNSTDVASAAASSASCCQSSPAVVSPAEPRPTVKSFKRKSLQINIHPKSWEKVYERVHPPSMRQFVELKLDNPIKLRPDEMKGVYVHSTLPGDESIVYDNQKSQYTHDDDFLQIRPGLAHLCNRPFGRTTLWGYGSAWRESREFVGRVSYGIVYKLWNPEQHFQFGPAFQKATTTMFMCQRRAESPLSQMPDDVLFYILNMCRWDWFNDTADVLRKRHEESQGHASADQKMSSSSDGEVEESSDYDAARRVSRLRGHWTSRSQYSFLSSLRRGLLMGSMGFGSDNDVLFVQNDDDDDSDEDLEDDSSSEEEEETTSVFHLDRYDHLAHAVLSDDEENEWLPGED